MLNMESGLRADKDLKVLSMWRVEDWRFVFGSGTTVLERKKFCARMTIRGKENSASVSGKGRPAGKTWEGQGAKAGKDRI